MLQGAEEVVTPLVWQLWEEELEGHPDREWVELLVRGIKEGFRLGHEESRVVLREGSGTMYEASEHRDIISEYLEREVQSKRVWKVTGVAAGIQCSPFGVIPKKGKPGRWRLIVNLSAPEGHSVNDGIDRELSSVAYTSVDDVVRSVGGGRRRPDCQGRRKSGLQKHSRAPQRQVVAGNEVGGRDLRGRHPAVRSQISPPAVHGG